MKHAGDDTLSQLEDLVLGLRGISWLRETRPGNFYRGPRAFLHFHEDPTGLFADVRLDPSAPFERVSVTTRSERRRLLAAIRRTGDPQSTEDRARPRSR